MGGRVARSHVVRAGREHPFVRHGDEGGIQGQTRAQGHDVGDYRLHRFRPGWIYILPYGNTWYDAESTGGGICERDETIGKEE